MRTFYYFYYYYNNIIITPHCERRLCLFTPVQQKASAMHFKSNVHAAPPCGHSFRRGKDFIYFNFFAVTFSPLKTMNWKFVITSYRKKSNVTLNTSCIVTGPHFYFFPPPTPHSATTGKTAAFPWQQASGTDVLSEGDSKTNPRTWVYAYIYVCWDGGGKAVLAVLRLAASWLLRLRAVAPHRGGHQC